MEEQIEASVLPSEVWRAWERAHAGQNQKGLKEGEKDRKGKFAYQILNVKEGESFSILWKSLFVRLIFTQSVKPTLKGSLISYQVQIKGPFAWAVRWLIGEKVRKSISSILKAIVKELEYEGVK